MSEEGDRLHPGPMRELEWDELPDKELLAELVRDQSEMESFRPTSANRGGGEDWDAPFDLRVVRPYAEDLAKRWELNGERPNAAIAAAPPGRVPIVLNHVVTAFPKDGLPPGRVWALGYEFVLHDVEKADTVGVAPSNELLRIAGAHQQVSFGLDLRGKLHVPGAGDGVSGTSSMPSLKGASISFATGQQYQFEVTLDISLRKVVGAPVGVGGAQWKLYRQNERLDSPNALLQTLLVPQDTKELRCTVKTWAMRAGFLGMRWGARFWPYPDQDFTIYLE